MTSCHLPPHVLLSPVGDVRANIPHRGLNGMYATDVRRLCVTVYGVGCKVPSQGDRASDFGEKVRSEGKMP